MYCNRLEIMVKKKVLSFKYSNSIPSGHGGQTSPPISQYFSVIFSPNHIELTNNNPNKDSKSVERLYEVEKIKLDRKIFSSLKIIKKSLARFERVTFCS